MCSICLQTPCDSRCPNASGMKGIHTCSACGEEIFEGDKYLEVDGEFVCEECINEMPRAELIEMLGEELKTA